mmetsp:Transcript_139184/g.259559  ORF Transcript_139184/g.259559 Transcript_139184/m.259559 type:complete len:109 (+) Transcript_139184:1667-1993(+)
MPSFELDASASTRGVKERGPLGGFEILSFLTARTAPGLDSEELTLRGLPDVKETLSHPLWAVVGLGMHLDMLAFAFRGLSAPSHRLATRVPARGLDRGLATLDVLLAA